MSIALQPTSSPPEAGQLVVVRNRHWLVADVALSGLLPDEMRDADERPQHLVELTSAANDGTDDELRVIWVFERGARVFAQATLPTPVATHTWWSSRRQPPES